MCDGLSNIEEETMADLHKYKVTGDFEKDFTELCSIVEIQFSVAPRIKVPFACRLPKRIEKIVESSPAKPKSGRQSSRGSRRRDVSDDEKSAEIRKDLTPQFTPPTPGEAAAPTTYIVSEANEFFKPRIAIATEAENNKKYTKELYLRGWLADMRVMNIFSLTLPYLEMLTVLDMWNTGLTDETLNCLCQCLTKDIHGLTCASSLKSLSLDGNHLATKQNFGIFISPDSKLSLQNFSLRNCNLDESGGLRLGRSLANNRNLLTLNLCYNKLGDAGVRQLATALRFNYTLVSLNIGSNEIGDEGVKYISEALSIFPLSHEEVITRRKMLSKNICGNSQTVIHPPLGRDRKLVKGKAVAKKSEASPTKGKRDRERKKSKGATPVKTERTEIAVQEEEDEVTTNPILAKAREINGELWIPGNRTLINLNLSRNHITKIGLESLKNAMLFQGEMTSNNMQVSGTGLLRLNLRKNNIPQDDPAYLLLSEMMKLRDPLYKETIDELLEEDN